MSKPKAPAPVDQVALTKAQGEANLDAARYNAGVNRADQITPEGSLTWSLRPGADPRNPQPGDYIQTTALSPEQQGLYDAGNRISGSFLNTAEGALGRVGDTLAQPFSTEGLPGLRGAPTEGLPALTMGGDDARRRVEEAMMSRIQPQYDRDRAGAESRLLNAGIERGTEAWNREMDRLDRGLTDARMQAILAGGQEQSRMAGLESGIRGQLFGEGVTGAGLDNTARQQGIQELSYLRSLPINEVNALRTGSQVSMPSFPGYSPSSMQATDPLSAAMMTQNAQNSQYQSQMAGYNGMLGSAATVAAAFF